MTRPRTTIGWIAVVAVLLVILAIAAAQQPRASDTDVAGGASSAPSTAGTASADTARATAQPRPSVNVEPASPSASTPTPSTPSASGGLVPGSVNATSIDLTAEYDATVRLDFGTRAFRVDSAMTVTNTSGSPIDRLELNTVAARLGGMTLAAATVNGAVVHPAVSDQTIHLPLGGVLPAGQTVSVRISYRSTLRSDVIGSNWLFTRTNGVLDAYRWLPWVSKPIAFDRPNHGDPFETPVSPHVRVRIVSDRVLRYATTGEQVADSGLTKVFEATNVRDFAFTAAPDYAVQALRIGGVTIRVWGRPGFPSAAVMRAARVALSREAALLGAYPYKTYDVAQAAGGFGMESPGLTWIPRGVGVGNIPYLVAHETGHQWFYGIVGNDQATEPYADEAATDFVARYVLGLRRASGCATARLDLTIYQYSSACYYEDVYIQGGNFLDDTRRRMGSIAFWAAIRDYLATNRFKIAGTKTLLDTLDAHTPLDLVQRYHLRFPGMF